MSDATAAGGARSFDVDVIIVAHDAGDLLVPCVGSAEEQVGAPRVVVIDAESTDGSVAVASASHPGITVLQAPNAGFAASNNAGLAATAGRFALLLNPDAELLPGAVAALVARAEAAPRAGIVGAAVLNADGSWQANQAGAFPTLLSVVGLRMWRAWQRLQGNRALSPRRRSEARQVDWVTGACMLVRREAVADAGPMDEAYFLYYEDVEWCHRMRDRGWDVIQEPSAKVTHHLGKAGGGSPAAGRAYRESFFRYCEQYGLWGLKAAARLGLAARSATGGGA